MDKGTAREVFLHNFRRLIAFDNRPQSDFAKYMDVNPATITDWKEVKDLRWVTITKLTLRISKSVKSKE